MPFIAIQYPESVHCPRGNEELAEFLQDVRFATKVLKGEADKFPFHSPRHNHAQRHEKTVDFTQQLTALKKHYQFDEKVEVYLKNNAPVIETLLEAVKQIRISFEETYKHALTIPPQTRKLFVDIQTHLQFEEAIESLSDFDNAWWFKQPVEIRSKLEFSLDIR